MVSGQQKQALVFECQGERLVGILTKPKDPSESVTTALIALPAGGPQYRVGLARQLLQQASYLCERNIAVLRFDYRGIGDSEGEFQGFRSVEPDLRAAINELKLQLPGLKNVILWGGCNAASAIMILAHKLPEINGIVVSNPFLGEHNLGQQAKLLHFYSRIKQKSFWRKLLSGKYDLRLYLKSIISSSKEKSAIKTKQSENVSSPKPAENKPVKTLDAMLDGMTKYPGHCLLLLSDRSIQSNEFKALLKSSKPWRKLFKRPNTSIVNVQNTDQNFSSLHSQQQLRQLTYDWIARSGFL